MLVENKIFLYHVGKEGAFKIDVTNKPLSSVLEFIENNKGENSISSDVMVVDEQ